MALAAHATKDTARLALNASPEPFSNWVASVAEDVTALLGIWIIFHHPWLMLVLVVLFVATTVWLAPKIWRRMRALFGRVGRWFSGPQATATPAG